MYRTILVPLDGSPFGEHALPGALAVARATGARLRLVHAHVGQSEDDGFDALTPYRFEGWQGYSERIERRSLVKEAEKLAGLARSLSRQAGVRVSSHVLDGPVVESIEREVGQGRADLVVMATHWRSGLERARLGSVARAVVQHAKTPVLLIRPPDEAAPPPAPAWGHIVIALDGSGFAEQILQPALELGAVTGARFTLVRVSPPAAGAVPIRASDSGALLPEWQAEAHSYLERAAGWLRERSLEVRTWIEPHDDPAEALLHRTREDRADVIAMATHAREGISGLLLGSVTDRVVRHSPVPVLVFRPRAAAGAAGWTRPPAA